MVELRLPPGRLSHPLDDVERQAQEAATASRSKIMDGKPAHVLDVAASRDGGASVVLDVPDNALVEIELEKGVRIWTSALQAKTDFSHAATFRGTDDVDIPATLEVGGPSRGVVALAVKTLKFFGVDLEETVSWSAAMRIMRALEREETELFRVADPSDHEYQRIDPADIPVDRPILVLLHGTGSTTQGSFGVLGMSVEGMEGTAWERLQRQYGGHIFALQHRSLSESPVENALTLVRRLPVGAELHLLSYSRGGLIGELLTRAGRIKSADGGDDEVVPFDETDLRFFTEATVATSGPARDEDIAEFRRTRVQEALRLKELSRLLVEKRISVTRLVRVACPAKGTTLASERLDRYLTVTLNVLQQIPFLRGSDVFEITAGLLQAIVETRTDPRLVPGLEAMMPKSPLIAMLNNPEVKVSGTVIAIAGDVEPEGFLQTLSVWASDLFYDGDHDYVVDTSSMLAGVTREKSVRYLFDKGPDVNHFAYFSNAKTLSTVLSALAGEDDGLDVLREDEPPVPRAPRVLHAANVAPTLFVLPGIMGTEMVARTDAGGERTLWLSYWRMALGALAEIANLDGPVRAGGPLNSHYDALIAHMQRSHHVLSFGFDWRRRLIDEADALKDAVTRALDEAPDQPVRFIAHSMGGLLVRIMMARHREVWDRVAERRGSRLVMLGTPNGGSHAIVERLVGLSAIVRQIHSIDVTHTKRELLTFLRKMPGVLDLLPHASDGVWFTRAQWQHLHAVHDSDWEVPEAGDLATAAEIRDILGDPASRDDERTCYVAGLADETPIAVEPDPSRRWGPKVRVLGTRNGDGLVPWETGILDRSRTWYAQTVHADLSRDPANFAGYEDLLHTGATSRLPAEPPGRARGTAAAPDRPFEILPKRDVLLGLDTLDLIPMGGGVRGKPLAEAPGSAARVSIEHANLAFSGRIIAVGHYDGEPLVGAEAYIDGRLGGRLEERRRLDLYPGPLGTSEAIFGAPGSGNLFRGAVIIGLGRLGELTAGGLSQTLTRAFMEYALRMRDERLRGAGRGPGGSLELATLLIGQSESKLTVRDAIVAMLDALVRANRILPPPDRILDLRIVELYDAVAHMAAGILQQIENDGVYARDVKIDPFIRSGEGGRRSTAYSEDRGYYDRIAITERPRGSLQFTIFRDSAAVRSRSKPLNKTAIDAVLDQLIRGTSSSREDSRFLFELMLPLDLKRMSSDQRKLHLILDEAAAAYPWELMDDRKSENAEPLPVRTQITRQLSQRADLVLSLDAHLDGALVVGDPISDFVELRGAQREAQIAAEQIGAGLSKNVTPMIRPNGLEVIRKLLQGSYKLVHLAGHGEYLDKPIKEAPELRNAVLDTDKRASSGMVLGKDLRLDATIIDCLPYAPELVFLNCCHLGGIARPALGEALWLDRHRLAASLAVAFMRRGCKAVVAAGWEVDDEAAAAFATAFYRALSLDGETFGEAVKVGRRAAFEAAPGRNTWGAYQCYGDPDYRLVNHGTARRRSRRKPPFVALSEAIREIENIREDVTTEGMRNRRDLLQRLETARGRLRADWNDDPELNIAIAQTMSDVGEFASALEHYDKAIRASRPGADIYALEQRANLRARLAALRFLGAGAEARETSRAGHLANIRMSIDELEGLISVAGPSVERLWLLASAHRRRSVLETDAAKFRETLMTTARCYLRAYEASRSPEKPDDWHRGTAINGHHSAFILRAWSTYSRYSARARKELSFLADEVLAALPNLDAIARRKNDAPEGFWEHAALGDIELSRALMAGDLAAQVDKVFESHRQGWEHGGTHRNLSSVLEGLSFFIEILGRLVPQRQDGELAHLPDTLKALEDLRRRLERLRDGR